MWELWLRDVPTFDMTSVLGKFIYVMGVMVNFVVFPCSLA